MSKDDKLKVEPVTCVYHNEKKYDIEVELRGIKKDDIQIIMGTSSFCLDAANSNKVFQVCQGLCHKVIPHKAVAIFEEGLLRISVPIEESFKGVKLKIT